ncbi:MAG: formylglycine-generating enzyme family protein [Muribaculaceae bacterium]|nr:formylglycine-generating enzyme family protein [Muribaculaceae bacterium]
MAISRKSALIMLVLDCSSSLSGQLSTVKNHANNFVSTLAGYGNDERFSAIDINFEDVISSLEKDEMVFVEGGTFTMGATSEQSDYYSNELPTHEVTLSDFYIGKYEVTQQLWEYVMNYTGTCADGSSMSAYASDVWLGSNPSATYGLGNEYPASYVSWEDIVNIFIPRLNKITGKKFRLPTEAEWEYAARGGNQSQGYKYSGSNTIGDVAWYRENSQLFIHSVGSKQPNELGIYDMSGNVWEWCSDWYGSYTAATTQTDPTGPSTGYYRVHRGGGWGHHAQGCRVSFRDYVPDGRHCDSGFRLALSH